MIAYFLIEQLILMPVIRNSQELTIKDEFTANLNNFGEINLCLIVMIRFSEPLKKSKN